jgi:hypothetical protein
METALSCSSKSIGATSPLLTCGASGACSFLTAEASGAAALIALKRVLSLFAFYSSANLLILNFSLLLKNWKTDSLPYYSSSDESSSMYMELKYM